MTVFEPELAARIGAVRADVARLHAELVRYGLVVWTAGNVSGRVPGTELFVIKPSETTAFVIAFRSAQIVSP